MWTFVIPVGGPQAWSMCDTIWWRGCVWPETAANPGHLLSRQNLSAEHSSSNLQSKTHCTHTWNSKKVYKCVGKHYCIQKRLELKSYSILFWPLNTIHLNDEIQSTLCDTHRWCRGWRNTSVWGHTTNSIDVSMSFGNMAVTIAGAISWVW